MKNLITYCIILLCLAMMLLGCYSQKRAVRQLYRVQANYPNTVAILCSSVYPPISSTKDSIAYLPGEAKEELVFVEVDCDSILKSMKGAIGRVQVPCPPSVIRIDTLLVYKEKHVVDRAKLHVLSSKLAQLNADCEKVKYENYILFRIVAILGIYTLLRWLLRIWHIKLP